MRDKPGTEEVGTPQAGVDSLRIPVPEFFTTSYTFDAPLSRDIFDGQLQREPISGSRWWVWQDGKWSRCELRAPA